MLTPLITNKLAQLYPDHFITTTNQTDNLGFEFSKIPPIFTLSICDPYAFLHSEKTSPRYCQGEDPDIEMLLFSSEKEACDLLELIVKEEFIEQIINIPRYTIGVHYGIFKVNEGWLLTWHDTQLDFGGNIIAYKDFSTKRKELSNLAIAEYADCHFSQNAPYVRTRDGVCDPEQIPLWISIFEQLGIKQEKFGEELDD